MLKNLDLKASALDELDLPVKVLAGHLGKLITDSHPSQPSAMSGFACHNGRITPW